VLSALAGGRVSALAAQSTKDGRQHQAGCYRVDGRRRRARSGQRSGVGISPLMMRRRRAEKDQWRAPVTMSPDVGGWRPTGWCSSRAGGGGRPGGAHHGPGGLGRRGTVASIASLGAGGWQPVGWCSSRARPMVNRAVLVTGGGVAQATLVNELQGGVWI
jgi:hypothetical protein